MWAVWDRRADSQPSCSGKPRTGNQNRVAVGWLWRTLFVDLMAQADSEKAVGGYA